MESPDIDLTGDGAPETDPFAEVAPDGGGPPPPPPPGGTVPPIAEGSLGGAPVEEESPNADADPEDDFTPPADDPPPAPVEEPAPAAPEPTPEPPAPPAEPTPEPEAPAAPPAEEPAAAAEPPKPPKEEAKKKPAAKPKADGKREAEREYVVLLCDKDEKPIAIAGTYKARTPKDARALAFGALEDKEARLVAIPSRHWIVKKVKDATRTVPVTEEE